MSMDAEQQASEKIIQGELRDLDNRTAFRTPGGMVRGGRVGRLGVSS